LYRFIIKNVPRITKLRERILESDKLYKSESLEFQNVDEYNRRWDSLFNLLESNKPTDSYSSEDFKIINNTNKVNHISIGNIGLRLLEVLSFDEINEINSIYSALINNNIPTEYPLQYNPKMDSTRTEKNS